MGVDKMTAADRQALNEQINHSPLLALPREIRAEMLKKKDVKVKDFIDLLIVQRYGASPIEAFRNIKNPTDKEIQKMENMGHYWEVMCHAFTTYDATKSTENGFLAYVDICCDHAKKTEQRSASNANRTKALSAKDSKLLRDIFTFIETKYEKDAKSALNNASFRRTVAQVFHITENRLLNLLLARQSVLSLEAENDKNDDDGEAHVHLEPADDLNIAHTVEEKELQQFAMILQLFNLEQKDIYAKKHGLCWSKELIEYLRGNEVYKGNNRKNIDLTQEQAKIDPVQECIDRDGKLARCEELAPLDEANCLWNVLLLEDFVRFLIAEPLPGGVLPPVALNPLKDPAIPPSNKALAAYLGISESAASQKMKKWKVDLAKALCALKDEV